MKRKRYDNKTRMTTSISSEAQKKHNNKSRYSAVNIKKRFFVGGGGGGVLFPKLFYVFYRFSLYIKVTESVSVCLSVPKDLSTNMVLLFNAASPA